MSATTLAPPTPASTLGAASPAPTPVDRQRWGPLKADAVFEGGGVRGIGLVGALSVLEEQGYAFGNLAGTSAGAIVAALKAAGYTGAELRTVLTDLDLAKLTDAPFFEGLPLVGPLVGFVKDLGLYKGDYFLGLMRELLAKRGITTFGQLRVPDEVDERFIYKVRVVAADLTRGRMLILPQELTDYGADPDRFEVANAVRMSMSIPFFFRPVNLPGGAPDRRPSVVVDGGLLSNFPVDLFDVQGIPPYPTFGFRLVEQEGAPSVEKHDIRGPISMLRAMFDTMMNAHDARYIATHNFVRTIAIPTLGIGSTAFDLTPAQKEDLYQSGRRAAYEFLRQWDWSAYLAAYRATQPPSRRELAL